MGNISSFHASILVDHVSAENLVPADESCPVCLFSGPRAAVQQIQTTPDIYYLKCPSCGACSTSAMPSPVYLEDYYNKYYAEADTDANVTIRNVNRFARDILNRVTLPSENNVLQILDFGGGDGSVAIAISEIVIKENSARKTNIVLIDYSEPKQINNQNISISKRTSLDYLENTFDLVLASAILEHIPFVSSTIRGLAFSLRPGGYFYARTPYNLPLKRIYPGFDLMFPMHVHDMGIEFWNQIVDTFGLPGELVESRPAIVESEFKEAPFRTLVAHVFKFPALIELAVRKKRRTKLLWPFVGGWEVVIRRSS